MYRKDNREEGKSRMKGGKGTETSKETDLGIQAVVAETKGKSKPTIDKCRK